MNEEKAVYILKEARINQKCKLVCPDNTEDCLDCENEAIQVILKLYEKQNNKIQKALDFINDENNFFEDGESWQNVLKIKEILEEKNEKD